MTYISTLNYLDYTQFINMSKNTGDNKGGHCLSFFDAFDRYTATLKPGAITLLKSALVRFVVPVLGGPSPKGERASRAEIAAALEFMTTVPSNCLAEAMEILNTQMDKQGVKPEGRHVRRSHVRQFVAWSETNGLAGQSIEPIETGQLKSYRFRDQYVEKIPQEKYRERKPNYALEDAEISERLAAQFKELEKFNCFNLDVRPATNSNYLKEIRRLLGWLHRVKGVPLRDLSLERIVPYVKMRYHFRDFDGTDRAYEQYAVATVRAKDDCIEAAKSLERLLNEFFRWRNASPVSDQSTTNALVTVGKFLYDSDVTDYDGPETIPVIKKLQAMTNKLGKEYKNEGRVMPLSDRMVNWPLALDIVLHKLPVEADIEYLEQIDNNGRLRKRQRSKQAMANSLHQLLMLSFFVLIPPDRQRTWRELEIGRTLKRGIKEGKRFIPVEHLKPEEQHKAGWWVHLKPEDYKTGATYKEVWNELPDVEFPNGRTLYGYIDRWLNEYRAVFNPNCKNFFVQREGKNKGKPISSGSCTSCIRIIFLRFTGVPVTPHILRDMFATYIREQGATLAELEGAARWMRHSIEMANKVYDQRTHEQKSAPAIALTQRIIQEAKQKPST